MYAVNSDRKSVCLRKRKRQKMRKMILSKCVSMKWWLDVQIIPINKYFSNNSSLLGKWIALPKNIILKLMRRNE